jgi:hypothetical protein
VAPNLRDVAWTLPPPASAEPFGHLTFHVEFDSANDCGDGLVLEFHDVMDGRQLVVWRGDGYLYGTQHDLARQGDGPRAAGATGVAFLGPADPRAALG